MTATNLGQVWWYTPVMTAPRRLEITSSKPAWDTL